jgi:serine/threonine-protein kinase
MKPPLSLGLTLRDRYTVVQILDQEPSARVYLVEDEAAGDKILLMREFFSENDNSFQEIRMLFQTQLGPLIGFKHPHLQQFYETFVQDENLYVVEAYLDDNANALFSNGFSEDLITSLLQQMLTALNQLHQVNVYHRNISPTAIFQLPNTEYFELRDFWIFQNIRILLGSVAMPKYGDQIKELSGITFYSDKDVDLYGLAVTAVSLFTGKPLTDLFDPYTKACIWERYRLVSDRLANVLNKMLAVDPITRFSSAAAALDALSGNVKSTQNVQSFTQYAAPALASVPSIYAPANESSYSSYDSPNSYEQSSSEFTNNWQTQAFNPAAGSQGNNKWLVGVGIVGGVMLLAIAATLATKNSQPQIVSTPTPTPTVVVTVTSQPTSQPNTQPADILNPTPTASSQNVNLTEDEARQLITNWQNAKPTVFAFPFDRQLAARYTTGSLLQDIIKPNGSMDWLRQNNSYYKYGFRSVGAPRFISRDTFQAIVEVRLIEQYTMYRNGKVVESESDYYDKVVRFVLRKEDGSWKISDRKSL